jgi:hypothetical protein
MDKLASNGPWPYGMDNIHEDHELSSRTLRNAVNVDITAEGTVRRRKGYTSKLAGAYHSLYNAGAFLLAVKAGSLMKINVSALGVLTETALATGFSTAPVAYTKLDGVIYYTNGTLNGKLLNGQVRAWGLPIPLIDGVAAGVGALPPGRYHVALTFLTATGEESSGSIPGAITLVTTGGIVVTLPTTSIADVNRVRIYVTSTNSETYYMYSEVSLGTVSVTITASTTLGHEIQSLNSIPPPVGSCLESFAGRLWIGTGNSLYFTELFTPNRSKVRNYFSFEEPITDLFAVTSGMYVSTDSKTYWLSGLDVDKITVSVVLEYPMIRGTARVTPFGNFWFSTRGLVMAGENGEAKNVTDQKLVFSFPQASGASMVREENGLQQIIGAYVSTSSANPVAASDYYEAEIVRAS